MSHARIPGTAITNIYITTQVLIFWVGQRVNHPPGCILILLLKVFNSTLWGKNITKGTTDPQRCLGRHLRIVSFNGISDYVATVGPILMIPTTDPMNFWFRSSAEKISPLVRLRDNSRGLAFKEKGALLLISIIQFLSHTGELTIYIKDLNVESAAIILNDLHVSRS